jgi:hypothetical protein
VPINQPSYPATSAMSIDSFPTRWNKDTVVRLSRTPRASAHPRKYRPINFLSAVGETVDVVLLHRLEKFVEAHKKVLPEIQFGFRRGHSATQQLLHFVEWTTRNFNLKKSRGVLFLMLKRPLVAYGTRISYANYAH